MSIEITDCRVFPFAGEGKTKAFASITFNDEFVVQDLKIVEGSNGLFVAMPSKKVGDEYKDSAFPLSKELREAIQTTLIDEYETVTAESKPKTKSYRKK